MNDHWLEELVHFPTREKNTLDLIMTSLPAQFVDIHSPDRLNGHDIFSGILKVISPLRNLGRSIVIRKVITNLLEKKHLNLQKKSTLMVTQILTRSKKTSI